MSCVVDATRFAITTDPVLNVSIKFIMVTFS